MFVKIKDFILTFLLFVAPTYSWATSINLLKPIYENYRVEQKNLHPKSQPIWKVAIIFLNTEEDPELKQSIRENLKEIQSLKNHLDSSLTHLKVFLGNYDRHQPNEELGIQIHEQLKDFYSQDPKAKRILIFYSHGYAFNGVGPFSLSDLKQILVPVDILWMDSCFMANVEASFELRKFYRYYLASQDSELSSGVPYKTLSQLNHLNSVEKTSFQLAEAFMLSYSKKKNGSQSSHVIESATTISVIDSEAWPIFLRYFKKDWKNIKIQMSQNPKAFKKSQTFLTMDDSQFIDLGSTARLWGATDLAELLDVKEVKKARLNRDYDYVFLKSSQSDNPVKLIGYTMKIDGRTKTYTGLNISNPLFGDSFLLLGLDLYRTFKN